MSGAKENIMASKVFENYIGLINSAYLKGNATEHTYRAALQSLVEGMGKGIAATNEPKRIKCGAPDFVVTRSKRNHHQTIGYIECKDIGVDLKKTEKSEQVKKRYLPSLHNFILTDYINFRWYVDGELRQSAALAKEGKGGAFFVSEDGANEVSQILSDFLRQESEKLKSPKELASRLAGMTRLMRDIIGSTFDKESERGSLHGQYDAFKQVLLHDLDEKEFADMYAQTIAYGLFAARCHINDVTVYGKDEKAVFHGVDGDGKEFTRQTAAWLLPKTNPFLQKMFNHIAGPDLDDRVAWLVDSIVELFRDADMNAILRGFAGGGKSSKKDPVIHFYESFLGEYDQKLRKSRGVYYTPEPVVGYIVRSVDWLLKEKFGLKKGLADNSKVKYKVKRAAKKGAKVEVEETREMHKCLILDPAAGTGTFLFEVIAQIRRKMKSNKGVWGDYVRKHLLPRLFGFELMMAPYAICHMKLGLELADMGYEFDSDERMRVYLTNTLEEAEEMSGLPLFTQWLADEAREANEVKRDMPVMVVLGNPPYSGHSANASWKLNENGKKVKNFIGNLIDDYYFVDGKPLGERNSKWLQDDYVKFIRYGQHRIEQTGSGVLAFITNHGYLDNPTFRGMRQQLMETFSDIYILDLHGNNKKKEVCPDGSPDKNVFDIQQGVSIGIFVKEAEKKGPGKIHHADLWGDRKGKYAWLNGNKINTTKWEEVVPDAPFYLYIIQDIELRKEYEGGWKLTDIAAVNTVGIVTSRDALTIGLTEEEIWERVNDFAGLEVEGARAKYSLGKDVQDWKVHLAQDDLKNSGLDMENLKSITYRPFDDRKTYYTGKSNGFMCRARGEVMRHMLAGENLGLISARSNKSRDMDHFFCTRNIMETKCGERTTQSCMFPLYLYPTEKKQGLFDDGGEWEAGVDGRVPNLDKGFVDEFAEKIGLTFVSDGRGDLGFGGDVSGDGGGSIPALALRAAAGGVGGDEVSGNGGTFGPEDVFAYIYGVFHWPEYRERYAEFLKIDFPRVPMPKDRGEFLRFCGTGQELVGLHLMEADVLDDEGKRPVFEVEGSGEVAKGYPKYVEPAGKAGRVYINGEQYFDGVERAVWEFCVGGYQVCEKWLKDRRGRELGYEDVEHYQRIVVALGETVRVMGRKD